IQEGGHFPHFTAEKNVGLIPRLQGQSPEQVSRRVDEMLQLVDLDPAQFRGRYPHQLSGGQRQRVGVARALAGDPPILLMDEPFGALDPIVRAELQRAFKSLQRRLRKTVVLVTHDVPEALRLGTRIGLLESGALLGCYSPSEFLASSDPHVKRYRDAFADKLLEED
ncbi:MAG: ATP-binding cassette domain-containing protein, partial [Acidobacteriaceae bacterium]|nr:ATP-binding cassette domain-containing protein [Acidobacteriaceae bacterium]